jgi:diguanylate cyclase (GGDEF)-like protein
MKRFKLLDNLIPHIDEAFASFYDIMLNDVRLSVFFENSEQIKYLIQKQKEHFVASLNMPITQLKMSYIKLGEYHYDLRIPYVDFIKGTDILQESFLLNVQKYHNRVDVMDEIFIYFKIMKAFTAKGYLNKMIKEDKRDIESFFEQTTIETDTYLPKTIVMQKISWLKELLHSIEIDREFEIDTEDNLLSQWLREAEFLTFEKRAFFEDLEQRIVLNAKNLFYFLHREEYLEILPLYTSLLSIYKLTLMMNNAVTIECASKIIEDMKLDSLTQLFRKDLFEELLKKEVSLVEQDYHISVAYIDLDDFKGVNDNYGHYSGDKVLEKMGELIRKNIRASDIGFRIGGDEFAIIFKDASKESAKNVCEKIKADFRSYEFVFNDEINFKVSISVGVAQFREGETIKEFLEDVDRKLYQAKREGKNIVCV